MRRDLRRALTLAAWAPVAWLMLTAGSCATTSPAPIFRTVEVAVPVAVPCDPKEGPRPDYPDTDQALREAPGLFERIRLLLAGRELRRARETVLEAGIDGCRHAPGAAETPR